MVILLTIVHVLVCVFLVGVVLLQSGKAADLAGAFGGMGSQTTFGPRGAATVLTKATTIAAGLFMVTSLALAILETRNAGSGGGGGGGSVLERTSGKTAQPPVSAPKPVAPAGQPLGQPVPVGIPMPQGSVQPGGATTPPPAPKK